MRVKKHHNYECGKEEDHGSPVACPPCEQLPGTLIRLFIPAGAVINLLNLVEINSPSGVCLIVRAPLLGCLTGGSTPAVDGLSQIIKEIQKAGGTFEMVAE